MKIEKHITHEVQIQSLMWFGHTNRMDKTRWPSKVLKWVPQEKQKGGQLRQGWRGDIKEAMEARTLLKKTVIEGNSGDWG
jgi:hypothetical protein